MHDKFINQDPGLLTVTASGVKRFQVCTPAKEHKTQFTASDRPMQHTLQVCRP